MAFAIDIDNCLTKESLPMWISPPGIELNDNYEPSLELYGNYGGIFASSKLHSTHLLNWDLGTPYSSTALMDALLMDSFKSWPTQEARDPSFLGLTAKTGTLPFSTKGCGTPAYVPEPLKVTRLISLAQEFVPPPPGLLPVDNENDRCQRFAYKTPNPSSQYSQCADPITTLMICNIPCRITQQQLVDAIDALGFAQKYDFLYLPTGGRSSTTGSNLGYAFVNFTAPADAESFTHTFTDYQFEGTRSTKVCTVRPADIQGLENNVLRFARASTKAKARKDGPFIRTATTSAVMEKEAAALQGFNSCAMEEMNPLEPLYVHFSDDTTDFIMGCA